MVEIEKRLERTTQMFDRLLQINIQPLRLDYPKGPVYMRLYRQRDRENVTIGAHWRTGHQEKTGRTQKMIWKGNWHPKRVPPAIIRKMDEENYAIFSEINQIAKGL